jgi:hypothetical protein
MVPIASLSIGVVALGSRVMVPTPPVQMIFLPLSLSASVSLALRVRDVGRLR